PSFEGMVGIGIDDGNWLLKLLEKLACEDKRCGCLSCTAFRRSKRNNGCVCRHLGFLYSYSVAVLKRQYCGYVGSVLITCCQKCADLKTKASGDITALKSIVYFVTIS